MKRQRKEKRKENREKIIKVKKKKNMNEVEKRRGNLKWKKEQRTIQKKEKG